MKLIGTKKPCPTTNHCKVLDVKSKEINMTSHSLTQITVPFHSAELYLVEHNGQPYTPMRPIVENMGLSWASQTVKFNSNKSRWGVSIIETPTLSGIQEMLCIPLRKLFGWLMTISPNKVKPEIRETVIKYQNECDDVLWDYWTKGQAINPRTSKEERAPLTSAVNLLVAKTKHLNYSEAYKLVHQRFNVDHINEIPYDALPVAVEYVHHLIALYSRVNKWQNTEQNTQAVLHDQNVQLLMWYVPILAKFIKNEVYPALKVIQSNYAGRLSSLASETVCHANLLNRKAIGYGITLEHVDNKQPHSIEWYLKPE